MSRGITYLLMFLIAQPVAFGAVYIALHERTGADLSHYADHGLFVALHVIGGLTFGLLGTLQVAPWFRNRSLRRHRVVGRVVVLAGAVAGFSALSLNVVHPPAEGLAKQIGIYVFGTFFLFALTMAVLKIRRGALADHRAWMLRAYAVGMGPASQALIGLALALSLGEVPVALSVAGHQAGWILNLGIAEWAIRTPGRRPLLSPA